MKRAAIFTLFLSTLFTCAPAVEARESHKYALALFHFNIQYVAGGMVGFLPGDAPNWELDAEAIEDMIVVESFEPVIDLYASHPDWGVNIELQAYFIEVLAERHPSLLDKLRTLAYAGQIEIVSFHYSDQLFLAYAREDWERSMALTKSVFAANDLPLSGVVFCQEGQAGPGVAEAMADHGFDTLVWPKNLYKYQYGDIDAEPWYEYGGVRMILGPKEVDYNNGRVRVKWTFLDDGELLATGDMDPYFPPFFTYKVAAVCEYEEKLEALEADGYDITTVSSYMGEVLAMEIPPADPGPLLEGTWQPQSTDGIFRWLGGAGLWRGDERDNHVRTLCAMAHRELVAAETILDEANGRGLAIEAVRGDLDEAWRLLALGQVTDASGINPFRGEIEYGIAHAAEVLRIARETIETVKIDLGYGAAAINTMEGSVSTARLTEPGEAVEAPLDLVIGGVCRTWDESWTRVSTDPAVYRVEVSFSAGSHWRDRGMWVTFPGDAEELIFCPGLMETTPAAYDRSWFVWDHFALPLANGMIKLSDGLFVVKDTAAVHVAAIVTHDSGEVTFMNQAQPVAETDTWVFYLVSGELQEAVDFANGLNIWPTLTR